MSQKKIKHCSRGCPILHWVLERPPHQNPGCHSCFLRHCPEGELRCWRRCYWLVLGSPVQSGFSAIFEKTGTETGPPFLKFSKTETGTVIDRSTAVSCGFLQLQDRSEPVTVQTSSQPVPDRSYTYKYPYTQTPCTLYLLLTWPVLHGLVAFAVTVSEVAVIHGLHWKWRADIGNDGLMFETTGWHWKRQAHIGNDGLTFEMTGWHLKRQAHVRSNGGLAFETRVLCLKQWAHIQNDGLTFKMTGWRSKHWAHVWSNGRLAFETRVLCLKQWALVGVGGLRRRHVGPNVMLSSGGKWGNQEMSRLRFASSRTWWVSDSMHLLSYLSTPSQTPISH